MYEATRPAWTTARVHAMLRGGMRGIPVVTLSVLLTTWSAGIAVVEAQSTARPRSPARLDVPSLHLSVPLEPVPCEAYWGSSLPPSAGAFLADCSYRGFYGIVGQMDGALRPLVDAPRATIVDWRGTDGRTFRRALTATIGGTEQDPDGTWPGHGVPSGMPVFIAIRSGNQEIERQGTRRAIPSQVVIDATDQAVEISLQGEHADNLDRRVAHAHFVDPEHFSFELLDMALSNGKASVAYGHPSGAVSMLHARSSRRNLLITIDFRKPMSTFQVGIGGSFQIEVSFS